MNNETRRKIIHRVLDDYNKSSEEFTSSMCDFKVKGSYADLLDIYQYLMEEINGDYVYYIPDARVIDKKENIVVGTITEFSKFPDAGKIYSGSFKKFLELFNENNQGLYRIDYWDYTSAETEDNIRAITFTDFVW